MRTVKKVAAVVAVGTLAFSGLTACGNKSEDPASLTTEAPTSAAAAATTEAEKTDDKPAAEPVVIEYWHRLPDKDGMITVAQSAEEFNKSQTGIVAKTLKFEGDPDSSYDKISASIKTGNGPCLAQASYDGIPPMLIRGELMDVTDLAAKYKDNYGAGAWGQMTLGGKTYGLPQDTGPLVYYYDKAAFDELGIKAPTTWDEYFENARVAAKSGKIASALFSDDFGDQFKAISSAMDSNWFAVDGSAWDVHINDDKTMAIAKQWQDSVDEGGTKVMDRWGDPSPTDKALKDGVLIGYVGAAWEAAWNLDALGVEKADWHVAQMPDKMSGPWGGSGLVVLKGCKDPERALEYANWYNTNLEAMVSQGLVPAAKGTIETPPNVAALYGGQDVMGALTEAAAIENPNWIFIPTWPAVKKLLNDKAGKAPIGELLDEAQKVGVDSLKGQGLTVAE